MCRFGCPTIDTTHMCKWCGTRYCKECLRGDFAGTMIGQDRCGKCHHPKCQGRRVDYVLTIDDVVKCKDRKRRLNTSSPSKNVKISSARQPKKEARPSKKSAKTKRKSSKGKRKK